MLKGLQCSSKIIILEETMVSLKEDSDTPILYHCSVLRPLIEGPESTKLTETSSRGLWSKDELRANWTEKQPFYGLQGKVGFCALLFLVLFDWEGSLNIPDQNPQIEWQAYRDFQQLWRVSKGEAAGGNLLVAVWLEAQELPLESQPAVANWMSCAGKKTHLLTSPQAVCKQLDQQLTEDESSGSCKKDWKPCPVQCLNMEFGQRVLLLRSSYLEAEISKSP